MRIGNMFTGGIFGKKTPIAQDPSVNDLDKRVNQQMTSKPREPSIENKPIKPSAVPENAKEVTPCALLVMFTGRSKQNSSIVPMNISASSNSITDELSESSSSEKTFNGMSMDPEAKVEEFFTTLTSIKGKKASSRGQTIDGVIKQTKGAVEQIGQKIVSLDKKIARAKKDNKSFSSIEKERQGLIEDESDLGGKLDGLQKLSTLQNEISEYKKNLSNNGVFSFEADYDSIQEESSSVDTELLGSLDPESPIDKAKHSLLSLRKENLLQEKQGLLTNCRDLKDQNSSDIKDLSNLTKSVEKEMEDYPTAFAAVHLELLEVKKSNLEQKSLKLDSTISVLQEDLQKKPSSDAKLERSKTKANRYWNAMCDTLYNLPRAEKRNLLSQIDKQDCDPQVKQDIKELLSTGTISDKIGYQDAIA
ncbi:MAG: hypothetical protein V4489_07230, partial [Chlamydiota bacterium]